MQGKALEEESAYLKRLYLDRFFWEKSILVKYILLIMVFPDVPFFLALAPSILYSLWIRTLHGVCPGTEGTSDITRATQLISTLAALHPRSARICLLHNSLECLGAAGSCRRETTERPRGWSKEKDNLK